MATEQGAAEGGGTFTPTLPTRHLPGVEVRDLPAAPTDNWRIIGPGLVGAGVGLASGEFILWPYIASQVGLVFLWGAVIGVTTQWFLNMEIERYTLATGETALTGFSRLWRHWGLVFAVMTYFANMWPGWATSSATMVTYIFGGNVTFIAIAMLLICGAVLTLAPVVYTALERVIIVKVGAIVVFIAVAIIFAITTDAWRGIGRRRDEDRPVPRPGVRADAGRDRVRRRRWRSEPLPEQLDPRQGLRDGHVTSRGW